MSCASRASGLFRYWGDRVMWSAWVLYAANRFAVKPFFPAWRFVQGTLQDILLVPAVLPILLWIYRKLGVRCHDRPPTWGEIVLHVVVSGLFFEWIGPFWLHKGTADIGDVAAYAAGGLLAGVLWMRHAK